MVLEAIAVQHVQGFCGKRPILRVETFEPLEHLGS